MDLIPTRLTWQGGSAGDSGEGGMGTDTAQPWVVRQESGGKWTIQVHLPTVKEEEERPEY